MKTQVVSFVYVNIYVLYNNSCGYRCGGGHPRVLGSQKPNLLRATSPKNGGKYYWLFIQSITENNGCAMFEGKSVEIARSVYYV